MIVAEATTLRRHIESFHKVSSLFFSTALELTLTCVGQVQWLVFEERLQIEASQGVKVSEGSWSSRKEPNTVDVGPALGGTATEGDICFLLGWIVSWGRYRVVGIHGSGTFSFIIISYCSYHLHSPFRRWNIQRSTTWSTSPLAPPRVSLSPTAKQLADTSLIFSSQT